ncbi:hypothetical protein FQN54_007765 [Arachnomyces sp. PD_36]|nr:hypothetical protein FQN54_007765 [Arachnomyces sp. PD_36]
MTSASWESGAPLGGDIMADNHYMPQYQVGDGDTSIASMTPSTSLSSDFQPDQHSNNIGERQADSTAATTPTSSCAPTVPARHSALAPMATPALEKEMPRELVPTGSKSKRPLQLLDLPVEILKEIIKEITHTNDLTSLALTNSTLHTLAIPYMYARFDIVWPDTLSTLDPTTGVDALSYGLATLVMSEDIFRETPTTYRPSGCQHCGCSDHRHAESYAVANPKLRRGNYFAQYTRKFSVGNGPSDWVQEYSITKETGKMLGTLVALAVARMVNLEAFVWDMPTGVLRDVWIALASLANRQGNDCRLERVWVRWHDNSDNPPVASPHASGSAGPPHAPNVAGLPPTSHPAPLTGPTAMSSLFQRYGHVEYPTFSILPALKSLSVLDIDETAYLEEMSILIDRSREKLRVLRIGIARRCHLLEWTKPLEDRSPDSNGDVVPSNTPGWPRVGGVLSILLKPEDEKPHHHNCSHKDVTSQVMEQTVEKSTSTQAGEGNVAEENKQMPSLDSLTIATSPPHDSVSIASFAESTHTTEATPAFEPAQEEWSPEDSGLQVENADKEESDPLAEQDYESNPNAFSPTDESSKPETPRPSNQDNRTGLTITKTPPAEERCERLKLETLELERVHLSVPVLSKALDWTHLTSLTILHCQDHEKLWRALRRQFTPTSLTRSSTSRSRPRDEPLEYPLNLKELHINSVSPYFLLFLKETIAPNSLESLFLQDARMYETTVSVDAIYRAGIRRQRRSLKKLLVDSGDRALEEDLGATDWRKWRFSREMVTFITSGRMPQLRELGMSIDYHDWHYFLQRLPRISHLRSLYIPHVADHIHGRTLNFLNTKELALQVLDIITLRPEVELCYVGIGTKCFEIRETKKSKKKSHDDLNGSDGEDDDGEAHDDADEADDGWGNDGHGMGATQSDSESDVSLGGHDDGYSDEDNENGELDSGRSAVNFQVREILFYDDKVSIFRARHGEL